MTHHAKGQLGLHEHSYNSATALDKRYTLEEKTPGGYWLVVASFDIMESATWVGVNSALDREVRIIDTEMSNEVIWHWSPLWSKA